MEEKSNLEKMIKLGCKVIMQSRNGRGFEVWESDYHGIIYDPIRDMIIKTYKKEVVFYSQR